MMYDCRYRVYDEKTRQWKSCCFHLDSENSREISIYDGPEKFYELVGEHQREQNHPRGTFYDDDTGDSWP